MTEAEWKIERAHRLLETDNAQLQGKRFVLLRKLVSEKRAAGLGLADATQVSVEQILHDEASAK